MKTNDNCWFQFCFLITLVTICVLSFTSKAQSNRQWSTYYGGSSYEYAYGVATDDAGNVYITGETQSNYGITTGAYGAYQSAFGGAADAFLVKFNAAGVRIWATYYGGAQIDRANSIAIDPDGNIYLAGSTNSSSGIASPGVMGAGGAFQPSLSGSTDAFLLKLDAAGNRLWSTYYGGNGDDVANSVSCDAAGNVCIGGITQSFSGIASNGAYQTAHGLAGLDAFLVKFDKDGNRLWGTYFGGPGHDWGYGVSNDALGNIYLTGVTASITGIAFNGSQMTSGGGGADAFLVKFDASGARQWATYYGGSGYDFGNNKVATDAQNNVYLFGGTSSANGIAFNGFQMTFGGVTDGFLAKFNASGTRLWATYFGGPATEEAFSIAISNFGGIFINGDTYSSTGIASGGFQNSLIGSENQFIANFNSDGNRICSTYYGSVHEEDGSIATDNTGHVFLLANTYSNGGLASGGFQNSFAGARDAFLVKFSTCTNACCSAYGSSNVCDNDDITSVTFANVTTTTPSFYNPGQTCLPGYTNLSDNPVYSPDVYTFVPGCTYAFTAGIGLTAGSTYQEGVKVWIDFNDNCSYDPNELLFSPAGFTSGVAGNNIISGNVTIPITAPLGQHCMRIRSVFGLNAFTPSSIQYFGETEDYVITILKNADLGPDRIICAGECINLSSLSGHGTAYTWYNMSGMTVIGNTPSINVCPTVTTCYILVVSNAIACSFTDTICITVLPSPAQPTAVPSVQCGYGIPAVSVSGSGVIFHWYTVPTSGLPIPNETGSTLSFYYINQTTTFYVAEFNGTCESQRVAVVATVVIPDAITAVASSVTICLGQTIDLSFTQSGNTNIYDQITWTADDYNYSGLSGPTNVTPVTIFPSAPEYYTYYIEAKETASGCIAVSSIAVSVFEIPVIDSITASVDTICIGDMVTLDVYSADFFGFDIQNPFLDYVWTPGNLPGYTVIVSPFVTTTYTVHVTDNFFGGGCSHDTSITITVLPFPAEPIGTNSVQCGIGVPSCSVTGSGATFRWYLSSSSGTALPNENGNILTAYSISTTTNFYVSEFNGYCEGPRTLVTATVLVPPVLTLSPSQTVCDDEVKNLFVTSFIGDYDSYVWTPYVNLYKDPSGMLSYSGENLSSVYVKLSSTGIYVYTCTAINTITGCINTATVTVADSTDDYNACTIDFCDPQTGIITHQNVDIDDNDPCTDDACNPLNGNISHTQILNCGQSPICCPDFILKDAVNICDTSGIDAVACKKSAHTYTIYPVMAGFTYSWTIVGGTPTSFSGNPITILWDDGATGFIKVVITGLSNYPGCRQTIINRIKLIDGPHADFTINPGSPICKNSDVNFTNVSLGGKFYYWDFGDGTTFNNANPPSHHYSIPGTYIVTLRAVDQGIGLQLDSLKVPCGCTDTISKEIVVLADSVVDIISNCNAGCKTRTVCPGDTSRFCTSFTCNTYAWSVTGGSIISGSGTKCIQVVWYNTASAGSTTVSLSTPGCTGCNGTNKLYVPVLFPDLPISGPDVLCEGAAGSFSLPSLPGTYYNWTISPLGNFSFNSADQNVTNINVTFKAAGTYTIQCIYNNPMSKCPQGTSTFIVNVKPVFKISNVQPIVCEGTISTYYTNGNASWTTSPHGGNFNPVTASSTDLTWASFPGIYSIIATPTSPANFCNANAIAVVEVVAKSVLGNINGIVQACPANYFVYSITSNKTGSPFTWFIINGAASIKSLFGPDKDSAIIFLSGSGPWDIGVYQTIEISPGITCQSITKTIHVVPYTLPVFSNANPATVCVDEIVTYTVNGPPTPEGYNWSIIPPQQGTIISGQLTNSIAIRWHGPAGPATVLVSNCVGSISTSLNVVSLPVVSDITALANNGTNIYCDPLIPNNLRLSVPLQGGVTYQWNGPNGSGPGTNFWDVPSNTWLGQDDYYFTLTVSNGICSITKGIYIQLRPCNGSGQCNAPPACTFDFNVGTVCVDVATGFSAIPTYSGLSYDWNFGDLATSFESPTQHSYKYGGNYIVTLKIQGCPNIVQKTITVIDKPTCIITCPDSSFCPRGFEHISGCSGYNSYQWFKDGASINGAVTANYNAYQMGEYWLRVTNSNNCHDTSNHIYINQITPPDAKIVIEGNSHFCVYPSSAFTFSLKTTPNVNACTYNWSSNASATFNPNNTTSSNLTSVTINMPTVLPVSYQFILKVIDQVTGCEACDTICLTFYEQPYLYIQSIPYLDACEGTDVTLTPYPNDAVKYNYHWSNGANAAEITTSLPGYYALTITDKSSGCFATQAAGIIHPKPDLSLFPVGCVNSCQFDFPLYIPLPYNSHTYDDAYQYPLIYWYDNGDYNVAFGTGQSLLMYPSQGSHHISAIIQNGFGCVDTAGVLCLVKENCCDSPKVHVQCFGQTIDDCSTFLASGRLGITITGGRGMIAVTITQNGVLYQNTTLASEHSYVFDYLSAGHYCVVVTDSSGCKDSCCTELICCKALILSNCGNGNVSLCATIRGNCCSVARTFNWSGPGGFTSTSECITALTAGTYTVTITCSKGGTFVGSIEVNPSRNGWAVATNYAIQGSADEVVKLFDVRGNFNTLPKNINTVVPTFSDANWNTQAANISGAVFGLAHDVAGNIFVSATTVYGPVAFTALPSPAYSTGGGVYRLNANTNTVNLIASLPNRFGTGTTNNCSGLTPVSNQAPGLGNLCYDKFHGQLLVTNFEDGKIYRIDALNGGIIGDEFDPMKADNGIPGFAPVGERIWGIGMTGNNKNNVKIYYSVWANDEGRQNGIKNSIRSVQLNSDGSFNSITDVPEINIDFLEKNCMKNCFSNPVSDIEFSEDGKKMILAERTMRADIKNNFLQNGCWAHESRVLEYVFNGTWQASPNEYSIGALSTGYVPICTGGTSSAGGVDYGFGNINNSKPIECDSTVWSMTDAIYFNHNCGAPNGNVYGLQELHATGANNSVSNSVVIDYDNDVANAPKTFQGDVDIFKCCVVHHNCDTICQDFNNNELNGWKPDSIASNVAVSVSNVNSIGGSSDYYLKTDDLPGGSLLLASPSFNNWCCGDFCYDYRIFDDASGSTINVNPIFIVYNGLLGFQYKSNIVATENNGWHRVCAPVSSCGIPDSNSDGRWLAVAGTVNADWNTVISGITRLVFRIDYHSYIHEITGFDNVCFKPHQTTISIVPSLCNDSLCVVKNNCCDSLTYTWSNSSTLECISGFTEGAVYTVTATDQTGTTYTASIVAPHKLSIECFGGTFYYCNVSIPTGIVGGTIIGGVGLKTINVKENGIVVRTLTTLGDISFNFTGLSAGHYCVYVVDANGCEDSCCCDLILKPIIDLTATVSGPTCNDLPNGTVTAVTTGGNPPYDYIWSTGATTSAITSLFSGTYTVTVTDSNNCVADTTILLIEPSPITISSIVTNESCNFGNDGAITVSPNGGTPPFRIEWYYDSLTFPIPIYQYGATISGLIAGTYFTSITDTNDCGPRFDTIIVEHESCDVVLNLKLYVEGFYTGNGLMNTPLYYTGISADPTVCDSIRVDIIESNSLDGDPFTSPMLNASAMALLHDDGTANLILPGSLNGGAYYLAIFHRNAIQTWSATPVIFGAVNYYDFTDDQAKAYDGNQVEVETSIWAFYSGDINQDENIDLSDFPYWDDDNANFTFGYFATDLNGDTNSDLSDFPYWDSNNTNFVFSHHPY